MSTTTIQIYVNDWKRLNKRKNPDDSFAQVLKRVLDELETKDVNRVYIGSSFNLKKR